MISAMPNKLAGQNIIVTGAAGRIGSATARRLLQDGANLLLTDVSTDLMEGLLNELASFNKGRIHALAVDLTSIDGIDHLITKAIDIFHVIDGAVHSAYPRSQSWGSSFESMNYEHLCSDLSMQLGGAIMISQRLMRCFKEQQRGTLIHLSSIQGLGAPKFDHYAGTSMSSPVEYSAIKAGIISITKWLAKYHANQGIRVCCVSPGGIMDNQPQEFLERYRRSCTNIGMLSADHVASAISFLLSKDAEAINGQNLVVDDGWIL